jgi:hypothetical protein
MGDHRPAALHIGGGCCAAFHLVSQRGKYTLWSAGIDQCVLFTQGMIGEHADLLEVTTLADWKQPGGESNFDNKEKD